MLFARIYRYLCLKNIHDGDDRNASQDDESTHNHRLTQLIRQI